LKIPVQHVFATVDAVGGVWTYALDLAAAMAQRGIRTTLAVQGPAPSETQRSQATAIPDLELTEVGLPLDWTAATPDEMLDAAKALRELAAESGADIVHLNSPAFATERYAVPVVGIIHSSLATWWKAVRRGPLPEDFIWRTRMLGAGLAACDAVIAPSAAFADVVARVHDVGLPFVVHNGRACETATEGSDRQRIVVTSGRLWDPGKNATLLDGAAALIDAPLLAIGPLDGPNGERIVLRHARILGARSSADLREILATAPVFVSAALYEPFGLGVLEAAMAGCALVLSDIPTFRELWHGAAVFTPPQDVQGFARALQTLIDRPKDAERLGAKARQRAASLTVEAMAQGTLYVYGAAAFRYRQRIVTGAAA
jgi:glycosyltransferase involved in cell wall biosynthesis